MFKVNNWSLSKYRIGLIASDSSYSKEIYGCPARKEGSFAFLVQLVTPEHKRELGSRTKLIAGVKLPEL